MGRVPAGGGDRVLRCKSSPSAERPAPGFPLRPLARGDSQFPAWSAPMDQAPGVRGFPSRS
jgi:hypothetical protein